MQEEAFLKVIEKIRKKDSRYETEAYFFVREALDFTSKMLNKPAEGVQRHVKGQELLDGIKDYAIQEFGPIALTVLTTWGIRRTEDFGEIVFNLVDNGVLGKTEEDSRADFAGGYDFQTAFTLPFLPKSKPNNRKHARPRLHHKRRPADGGK